MENTDIKIFPGRKWIICLDVIVPEILENFECKILQINYSYSKLNKRKLYFENTEIDFEQYSGFLVYISEIDELKEINKNTSKEIKEIKKEAKNILVNLIKFLDLKDKYMNNIVTDLEKNE